MKLYKYRSFEKFEYIQDILKNKRFYLSRFNKLNDPMEGYFYHIAYETDQSYKEKVKRFISDKSELRICSFSKSLRNILLWTNYANNHKGIAIEITVEEKNFPNLYKVKYGRSIPELNFENDPKPFDVLERKIKIWRYEQEYRFIDKMDFIDFGVITGIFLGVNISLIDKIKLQNLVEDKKIIHSTYIDFNNNKVNVLDDHENEKEN
jgi:hypothetical protein